MAKQKLKGYYGNIGERQFRRYYEEAIRSRGDSGDELVALLERRLDAARPCGRAVRRAARAAVHRPVAAGR